MKKFFNIFRNLFFWHCYCGGRIKYYSMDDNGNPIYKCRKCGKIYKL